MDAAVDAAVDAAADIDIEVAVETEGVGFSTPSLGPCCTRHVLSRPCLTRRERRCSIGAAVIW